MTDPWWRDSPAPRLPQVPRSLGSTDQGLALTGPQVSTWVRAGAAWQVPSVVSGVGSSRSRSYQQRPCPCERAVVVRGANAPAEANSDAPGLRLFHPGEHRLHRDHRAAGRGVNVPGRWRDSS